MKDFGATGCRGPCPPRGRGVHHYRFRLLALSCGEPPVRERPACREVQEAAQKHLLAEARLVGLYER